MQRWKFPSESLEIAKMYLHTADYSMKKPCGIYELKNIQSILRRKIAYDIMLAGKKELKLYNKKSKSPRSCSFQGFLHISFFITVDKESAGQSCAVCSIEDNC